MTPVILTNNSVINTAEITWEHIVVAIILGNPCILNKGYKEPAEQLSFKHIGAGSFGNGFDLHHEIDTPQLMVEKALELNYKVAVFESEHWRQALQWLIDNSFNF